MRKLRLDLDNLQVESFAAESDSKKSGTVQGHTGGVLGDTCAPQGCTGDLCSVDCTGLGSECYTNDPVYYACTGEDPCTGAAACTYNTCTGYC